MRLRFGSIQVDTKGLPRVYQISFDNPLAPGEPVRVDILLADYKISSVKRWASRLGVETTEHDVRPIYEGDPWSRHVEAVLERGGYRVAVWTRIETQAPGTGEAAQEPPTGAASGTGADR